MASAVERPGDARRDPRPLFVELVNADGGAELSDLLFTWGALPPEARVHVAFEAIRGGPAVTAKPEVLKRLGIVVLRPRKTPLPAERSSADGRKARFDLERIYVVSAARETFIPAIRVPRRRTLVVAIQVLLPPDVTEQHFRFEVVQRVGRRVVGGSECFV